MYVLFIFAFSSYRRTSPESATPLSFIIMLIVDGLIKKFIVPFVT